MTLPRLSPGALFFIAIALYLAVQGVRAFVRIGT